MSWKFVLYVILMCIVLGLTIWGLKARHKSQAETRESVDLGLKQRPEEKFLMSLSDKVYARFGTVGFDRLTVAEKVFFCVWELEGEINDGGFDQFFFNSGGNYAVEAVDAFKKIGASKTAGIVRRANSVFKNECPPKNWTARQDELLALPESATEMLRRLDNEFYKYDEDLSILLYEFVIKHRGEFPGEFPDD